MRRLAVTALVFCGVLLLWLIFIGLHDSGRFEWALPRGALGWFGAATWYWLGLATMLAFVAVVTFTSFGVNEAPAGYAQGKLRQVQCQDCKAVFFVHDAGHRPLTHQCPNCKALGIYDGKAPPVGEAPKAEAAKRVVRIGLTCQECAYRFKVTDTGSRPLAVKCPSCQANGSVQ